MAFLAVAPSAVIALRGISDPGTIDLDISVLELLAALLAALGPAAMAVFLLWRDGRLGAAGFDRRPAGFIAGYGALGAVCCFIALWTVILVINIALVIGGQDLEEIAGEQDPLDFTVGTALAALAISLVAGVGEEIVYRAYAISRMEEAGFGRAAVWVPWAVFAAVHLYQGPLAVLVIAGVGGVFVWLYRWQRSIWPVMVAHAGYDAVLLLLLLATG